MAATSYHVERATTIDAPAERVYAEIIDFHRWTRWSPWEDVDPDLRRTYSGPASGPGAGYAWSGNRRAGSGRMEVLDVVEPTQVEVDLVFDKPIKAHNNIVFRLEPFERGVQVTWSMTGSHSLFSRVLSVVSSMDAFLGRDFEKGLARLKAVAETPA